MTPARASATNRATVLTMRSRICEPCRAGAAPRASRSALALGTRGGARPLGLVEDHLADAHLLGSHLDALVVARELQRLLEREATRRREALQLITRGRADVVELLLLGDVDVHVLGAVVLAHDHALV